MEKQLIECEHGEVHGNLALPERKRLDHRGPLSVDVSKAWYFITLCAEGHKAWSIDNDNDGRAARPLAAALSRGRAARPFAAVADQLLATARHYHKTGKWRLALFLVMQDHVHFIVHIPVGGQGAYRPTTLASVISDFKHAVSRRFAIRFQRDFFDTRLRDDAHYAEKFDYVCNNPVRKGLCAIVRDWPHVIVFNRETGEELEFSRMRR